MSVYHGQHVVVASENSTLVAEHCRSDMEPLQAGTAAIQVRDSQIGELLAMDSSSGPLDEVVVDGSDGYFEGNGTAKVEAYGSTSTCDVRASGNATLELHGSRLLPYPTDTTDAFRCFGAYEDGRLLLDATPATSTARVTGRGVVATVWLSDAPAHPPATGLPLYGTVALYPLDPAVAPFSWRLEAVDPWSAAP